MRIKVNNTLEDILCMYVCMHVCMLILHSRSSFSYIIFYILYLRCETGTGIPVVSVLTNTHLISSTLDDHSRERDPHTNIV